jgi:DNA-directed RNA polymerase beta subunit
MVNASTGIITVQGKVSQSINAETSFTLPLMVMFRLLGVETDEDIIDAIRTNGADNSR